MKSSVLLGVVVCVAGGLIAGAQPEAGGQGEKPAAAAAEGLPSGFEVLERSIRVTGGVER